jgi:hypothetical protein
VAIVARVVAPNILGYCTNVHPGESWAETLHNLRSHALRVKAKVDPSLNFGASMWLAAKAARELLAGDELERFKAFCAESGLRVFAINGFPYGNFHGDTVKHRVYRPDWTEADRLNYTLDLVSVAAELCPAGEHFGISTVPVSYKPWITSTGQIDAAVANLVSVAERMHRVERETGRNLHLDLEPEPLCYLETSADVVRFFTEHLRPIGTPALARRLGISESAAADVMRDKLRICYDTCHAGVEFETADEMLAAYDGHAIRVGRVQISSALSVRLTKGRTEDGTSAETLLSPFAPDRYLHQVIGREPGGQGGAGGRVVYDDLKDALAAWRENPPTGEYRIHYHVPIHLARIGALGTTQDHITRLLELSKTRTVTDHWEVETYTWDVMPRELRDGDIADRIAREIAWV